MSIESVTQVGSLNEATCLYVDGCVVMLIKWGGGPTGRTEFPPKVCVHLGHFCGDHISPVKAAVSPEEKDFAFLLTPRFMFLGQCFMKSKDSAMAGSSQPSLFTSKQVHTSGEGMKTTLLAHGGT